MIAFFIMSYKWTYVFPSIILLSSIGMHYTTDTWYYACLFLVIMSMFITLFTLPYGSVNISNSHIDSGYGGGEIGAFIDSGGDGSGC